ncbi:LAFA_0G06964g1_1 [Lachancea sp. 'fantastica']|nr:LAFA_0G06964g1_1 [Lachancea sp. 'fantastica']
MSSSDEDEKFLYGSEDEGAASSSATKNNKKRPAEDMAAGDVTTQRAKTAESSSSNEEEDDDSSEGEDSEDESDVEFIIGVGTDSSKLDSKQGAGSTATGVAKTVSVAAPTLEVGSTIGKPGDEDATQQEPVLDGTPQAQPGTERLPTLDLNAPGQLGDQLVTDIDPEVLKEKPWRQPGANLSDYFNYGFNEQTWMEYLHKQEKLRAEYNPHKLLMGLLALQQQGKLNDPGSDGKGQDTGMPSNMATTGFPMGMPSMFGGFPFPFPGMMNNMNQQQKK